VITTDDILKIFVFDVQEEEYLIPCFPLLLKDLVSGKLVRLVIMQLRIPNPLLIQKTLDHQFDVEFGDMVVEYFLRKGITKPLCTKIICYFLFSTQLSILHGFKVVLGGKSAISVVKAIGPFTSLVRFSTLDGPLMLDVLNLRLPHLHEVHLVFGVDFQPSIASLTGVDPLGELHFDDHGGDIVKGHKLGGGLRLLIEWVLAIVEEPHSVVKNQSRLLSGC